jgi:hypothetical protein
VQGNSPDRLHELRVHGSVVILEVDPPTQASHLNLPLSGVSVYDAAAKIVVLVDTCKTRNRIILMTTRIVSLARAYPFPALYLC